MIILFCFHYCVYCFALAGLMTDFRCVCDVEGTIGPFRSFLHLDYCRSTWPTEHRKWISLTTCPTASGSCWKRVWSATSSSTAAVPSRFRTWRWRSRSGARSFITWSMSSYPAWWCPSWRCSSSACLRNRERRSHSASLSCSHSPSSCWPSLRRCPKLPNQSHSSVRATEER